MTSSYPKRCSLRKRRSLVKFTTDAQPRVLEEDEVEELKDAYKVFDEDGDGKLARDEVSTVMRSLGQEISAEDLDKIFASVDEDNSGCINFAEFLVLMSKFMPKAGSSESDLKEAFDTFDKSKMGGISMDDLEHTIASLGFDVTPQQLHNMMACADVNRDGVVDFAEFKHIWEPNFAADGQYQRRQDSYNHFDASFGDLTSVYHQSASSLSVGCDASSHLS